MMKGLRRKFIVVSMLSTLLVLTVIIGSINLLNYRKIIQDADHVLQILLENDGAFPKNQFLPEQEPPDPPIPEKPFSEIMSPEIPYESRYFWAILNQDGTILSLDAGRIAAIDADTAAGYATQAWDKDKSSGFWQNYRYIRQELTGGSRMIFLDCGRNLSTFRAFLFSSIFVSVLGLVSVLVLVVIFSKIVMAPVSESYEKQRQFITDASHEIKTPLTIIDANAEILEMELAENEWLQGIRRQTVRLASLTNDLIYLSRMEESGQRLSKTEFSLSDLVDETSDSFQALARTRRQTLTVNAAPLISFAGEEEAVRRLLSILLDNALKYSPEQGRIEVNLQKKGKTIQLSVKNSVNSIEKEQLSRLFERFYRTDSSRNSETGGYGIGLSIAKAITEAHKGKIAAYSSDGKTLEIIVTF